jgi:hypothetical protein
VSPRGNSSAAPRATFDQQVIEAWSARLEARRKGTGRVVMALWLALAMLLGGVVFVQHVAFVLLMFGTAAALVFATLADRGSLLCPHCNVPPLGLFERGPATNADFCPHCHYWLRPPPWHGT